MNLLDQGYVELVETWGSDESIIEAARMSTGKGFLGWGPKYEEVPSLTSNSGTELKDTPGDEKLLAYLYNNKHSTPFEMAGMIIEVKAPIFVFREWHRHRTQSYNEMSARYIPLPDENYMPTNARVVYGSLGTTNKQAQGTKPVCVEDTAVWLSELQALYDHAQQVYERGIEIGVPKELARLPVPVARYSRMRASANLRNWIGFLTLRDHPAAQWEIRQYAEAVAAIIATYFPRTYALYSKEQHGTV